MVVITGSAPVPFSSPGGPDIHYADVSILLTTDPHYYLWETPIPLSVSHVGLGAIADEDYTQIPLWSVDYSGVSWDAIGQGFVNARLALRGPHTKFVRLSYMANIVGKLKSAR